MAMQKHDESHRQSQVQQSKSPPRQERDSTSPRPKDVLCGKGKAVFDHVGNRRFRFIVAMNIDKYHKQMTKVARSAMVRSITDQVLSSGARFLKRSDNTAEKLDDRWFVLSKEEARAKVSQTMRDAARDGPDGSTKRKISRSTKKSAPAVVKSHNAVVMSTTIQSSPSNSFSEQILPAWNQDPRLNSSLPHLTLQTNREPFLPTQLTFQHIDSCSSLQQQQMQQQQMQTAANNSFDQSFREQQQHNLDELRQYAANNSLFTMPAHHPSTSWLPTRPEVNNIGNMFMPQASPVATDTMTRPVTTATTTTGLSAFHGETTYSPQHQQRRGSSDSSVVSEDEELDRQGLLV
mmetsp:Transcript_298/g.494  ORF Transcript_298/g.494 Transcript_298/m.494 type:complete len:348 (-) Transcript_298:261-1304(-)